MICFMMYYIMKHIMNLFTGIRKYAKSSRQRLSQMQQSGRR